MTFEEASKCYDNNQLVTYQDKSFFVTGLNSLTKKVTIKTATGNPMFAVPIEVKPEQLS